MKNIDKTSKKFKIINLFFAIMFVVGLASSSGFILYFFIEGFKILSLIIGLILLAVGIYSIQHIIILREDYQFKYFYNRKEYRKQMLKYKSMTNDKTIDRITRYLLKDSYRRTGNILDDEGWFDLELTTFDYNKADDKVKKDVIFNLLVSFTYMLQKPSFYIECMMDKGFTKEELRNVFASDKNLSKDCVDTLLKICDGVLDDPLDLYKHEVELNFYMMYLGGTYTLEEFYKNRDYIGSFYDYNHDGLFFDYDENNNPIIVNNIYAEGANVPGRKLKNVICETEDDEMILMSKMQELKNNYYKVNNGLDLRRAEIYIEMVPRIGHFMFFSQLGMDYDEYMMSISKVLSNDLFNNFLKAYYLYKNSCPAMEKFQEYDKIFNELLKKEYAK